MKRLAKLLLTIAPLDLQPRHAYGKAPFDADDLTPPPEGPLSGHGKAKKKQK